MIASLRGTLVEALPTKVTVDVHGVGYEVLIPLSSFDALPPLGQEARLLTVLVVREDSHTLYGFATASERDLFRLLIDTVSGVGPKLALNVLSGMSPDAFRAAVAHGDVKALSQISGVGRKTAERIVVELRDRVGSPPIGESPSRPAATLPPAEKAGQDAVLALVALGFKQADAAQTIKGAQALLGPEASVESLVRAALKKAGS